MGAGLRKGLRVDPVARVEALGVQVDRFHVQAVDVHPGLPAGRAFGSDPRDLAADEPERGAAALAFRLAGGIALVLRMPGTAPRVLVADQRALVRAVANSSGARDLLAPRALVDRHHVVDVALRGLAPARGVRLAGQPPGGDTAPAPQPVVQVMRLAPGDVLLL